MDADLDSTDLKNLYPGWHIWRGVSDLMYARLLRSSPPVVVTAPDMVRLAARIEDYRKYGRAGRP